MKDAKKALRAELRRNPVPVDSDSICKLLENHPWVQDAHTILAYFAIPPEPDLRTLLEALLLQNKRILLPRCEDGGIMTAREISSFAELTPQVYQIPAPSACAKIVPPGEIDLILAPGVAFDAKGGRLGHGMGYYDRFFEAFHGKAIGICGTFISEVPMEPHDRRMDAVVTAHTIYMI